MPSLESPAPQSARIVDMSCHLPLWLFSWLPAALPETWCPDPAGSGAHPSRTRHLCIGASRVTSVVLGAGPGASDKLTRRRGYSAPGYTKKKTRKRNRSCFSIQRSVLSSQIIPSSVCVHITNITMLASRNDSEQGLFTVYADMFCF